VRWSGLRYGTQLAYTILSGGLTYTDPIGHYGISLWAKNITGKVHLLSAVPSTNDFTQLYFADLRTFGINLNVKFDAPAE